jgi:hypothetical protein
VSLSTLAILFTTTGSAYLYYPFLAYHQSSILLISHHDHNPSSTGNHQTSSSSQEPSRSSTSLTGQIGNLIFEPKRDKHSAADAAEKKIKVQPSLQLLLYTYTTFVTEQNIDIFLCQGLTDQYPH